MQPNATHSWSEHTHSSLQFCNIQPAKSAPRLQFFNIFTAKCTFRHSGVQFFDIRTAESAPKTTVFQHFHCQICFAPQRRTIIRHQTVQKCSRTLSSSAFSLPNVLFATAAYNYSTSERPKVLPDPQFFNIVTSKCAFRHSGVQFCDISTYKSALRTADCSFLTFAVPNVLFATAACNFWFCRWPPDSAPAALTGLLFDWPDTRIIEKNTAFRDFSNIYRGCIFFHLTLTLLHLLSTDLKDSTAGLCICFSTLHVVGSFYLNFLRSSCALS